MERARGSDHGKHPGATLQAAVGAVVEVRLPLLPLPRPPALPPPRVAVPRRRLAAEPQVVTRHQRKHRPSAAASSAPLVPPRQPACLQLRVLVTLLLLLLLLPLPRRRIQPQHQLQLQLQLQLRLLARHLTRTTMSWTGIS